MMMRVFLWSVALAFAVGTFFIVHHSFSYLTDYDSVSFVIDKGQLGDSQPWKGVLLVHVGAGGASLLACFLLFSRRLRVGPWRLHRIAGLFFVLTMVGLVLPSGFYLAFHATGGLSGTIGFLFNGFLVLGFLIFGWWSFRQGKVGDHAAWMTRAFAMAASAVTFRYLHVGLEIFPLSNTTNYLISLWGSLGLNYFAAEMVIARIGFFHTPQLPIQT